MRIKTQSCLLAHFALHLIQFIHCASGGGGSGSGSPSRHSDFKKPRRPKHEPLLDLNASPLREGSHQRSSSNTKSSNRAGSVSVQHQEETHVKSKGKEKKQFSTTPSLPSSSYSDSIKYYPTSGKIGNGEKGSQERSRSPTPDSARKRTKERSPTPESAKKRKAGESSPKGEPSHGSKQRRYGTPPRDPGISGTKKVVINSPPRMSSSSQFTLGQSGHSSSTLTPITAMLIEDELVYKQKYGHSPPPYQSHSDTRSYDYQGGYASSPSIQHQMLRSTASSRSPSPAARQRSPSPSDRGKAVAASSAQSGHNIGSSSRQQRAVTPPSPSYSSASSAGSSPHTGAVAGSPAHSGHSAGSVKSGRRSGSHRK